MKKIIFGILVLVAFVVSGCEQFTPTDDLDDPQLSNGVGLFEENRVDSFVTEVNILLKPYGMYLEEYTIFSKDGTVDINYESLYNDFLNKGGNVKKLSILFDTYGSSDKGGVRWYCQGNSSGSCPTTCNSVSPFCGGFDCHCWTGGRYSIHMH